MRIIPPRPDQHTFHSLSLLSGLQVLLQGRLHAAFDPDQVEAVRLRCIVDKLLDGRKRCWLGDVDRLYRRSEVCLRVR